MFARYTALLIAIVVLVHHIYKHPDYKFPDRLFEISDIDNHETWIIACLAFIMGTFL
jgi:hypothetical protein